MNSEIFLSLSFPTIPLKIYKDKDIILFFDIFRKKKIILTPEEWVRQHIAYYLVQLGYPKTSIALEKTFTLGSKKFRSDIVVYDQNAKPYLLVECKASTIPLNETVMQQIVNYNFILQIPYLMISNGLKTHVFTFDQEKNDYKSIANLPKI
jgi:hypothetical protein